MFLSFHSSVQRSITPIRTTEFGAMEPFRSIREDPDGAEAMRFAFDSRPFGLKPLTRETFDHLGDFVALQRFAAGEFIFREGGAGGYLYFVWKGQVELQIGSHQGSGLKIRLYCSPITIPYLV